MEKIIGKILGSLMAVSLSFFVAPFVALIILFPVALVTGYVPQVFDYSSWVTLCVVVGLWSVWFTDLYDI